MKKNPSVNESACATTLTSLGNVYAEIKDQTSARAVYKEAQAIYARLVQFDPGAYQADMALHLVNFGDFCTNNGEFKDARDALKQALSIYEPLFESNPDIYRDDLILTLNNLSDLYVRLGEAEAASGTCKRAVEVVESIAAENKMLHLAKGRAVVPYRNLLHEAIEKPERAFSLAAAQRDGAVRSSQLGHEDLAVCQSTLRQLQRQTGKQQILLIPTTGPSPNTLTMGLITPNRCKWWSLPCHGWLNLMPDNEDHSARSKLARFIWHSLPSDLQHALAPRPRKDSEILICADPLWASFPWELLHFGEGQEDYLGLHHALTRITAVSISSLQALSGNDQLGMNSIEVAVVGPHTTDKRPLMGVLEEVSLLEQRVPAVGGQLAFCETGEAAHDGLMRQAIESEPAILYFSGHGTIIANEEMLVLHAEQPLGPEPRHKIRYCGESWLDELALKKGQAQLFNNKPLVILNSCMTGRHRAFGGQREDLVNSFLRHGAGVVIASAMPIYDSVGEAFGEAIFSDRALRVTLIGDRLVEARRQLAKGLCGDIHQPTWGAWGMIHMHGNAHAQAPFTQPNG